MVRFTSSAPCKAPKTSRATFGRRRRQPEFAARHPALEDLGQPNLMRPEEMVDAFARRSGGSASHLAGQRAAQAHLVRRAGRIADRAAT